ncbi:hypothetical protein A1O3_00330 [Capronia epimyces CBS 606.96]|uniref:Dicer-like protein 2 n=1 Tax=Capronia epimyces CBS 606.96 TaxID=1182542 RepID=W9YQ27_9EURO|nr:uncharacterized protein A1O3_00330 [Capronia epimyces CBS 606.96]EXJ91780.1 hypothetical protein A1O3_00330 [Capronia epimyces CBS 606.96]
MEELDRCSQDQLVWFLAPTVALCTQQHEVLRSQLRAARTRLLIGADNVDRWSEKRLWDSVLSGVQIVVSTHAVLLDALGHGFVRIARLALLVFDEAHHCRRKHPANRIMQDFYHPRKLSHGPASVPHILGLTASPIQSKPKDLVVIETNLDSICRTPRRQRQEMLKFVNRPVVKKLFYRDKDDDYHQHLKAASRESMALRLLRRICHQIAPESPTGVDQPSIGTPLPTGGYEGQLVKFRKKAVHVYDELGAWAADYFILESIKILKQGLDVESPFVFGFKDDEKTKLLQVLSAIPALMLTSFRPEEGNEMPLSPKAECLIAFLAEQDPERCSGLVFVKQRAVVSVLHALLSQHPRTAKQFRCATFVGLSNSAHRRYSMSEMLDLKAQREALTELKAQVKNIIIATDVLEEGIDVIACNLVVCFDLPSNLKSFVQRRGRARQEQSTFAVLLSDPNSGENKDKIHAWQQLEEEMIRLYQDETRCLQQEMAEEPTENVTYELNLPSTGAKLTADGALGHLHHFCALLPPQPFVDLRPAFETQQNELTGMFTATVTLPNCVNASVRCAASRKAWQTQKAAVKDVAFQAYQALFHAGLLNDHLLPLKHDTALDEEDPIDDLPAVVEVSTQHDPWLELAQAWSCPDCHYTTISLHEDGKNGPSELEFVLVSPSALPAIKPIKMYWSECVTFTLTLGSPHRVSCPKPEILEVMREITQLIQRSIHSDQYPDHGNDFIALFIPSSESRHLVKWLETNGGRNPALDHFRAHPATPCRGFIRAPSTYGRPYLFQRWCNADTTVGAGEIELECAPLPKRRNFLRPETLSEGAAPANISDGEAALLRTERFCAQDATVDRLPIEQARFGLFIPGLLQHIEMTLVAQRLCATILRTVQFTDLGLVITAISCPSAQWVTNYQRLEFIGDSVLKFVVSQQLFVGHPSWHEGYLTRARAKLTSNDTFAQAAVRLGLDSFIIAEPVRATGKSYSHPRISDTRPRNPSAEKRELSSKTLADVVEALVGAAYVDGGFPLARACMKVFLPDTELEPPEVEPSARPQLLSNSGTKLTNFIIAKVEIMIGYEFQDKGLLLEALTHPTCERDLQTESYQRLEFLGDAVLDMLVVSLLATEKVSVSQGDMTRIKAAMVNGHLLGFFCLDFSTEEEVTDVEEGGMGMGMGMRGADMAKTGLRHGAKGNGVFQFQTKVRREQRYLWQYMRFHNQELAMARERSLARHRQLQGDIRSALATGPCYPWVLLTRLNPDKFLSDMIESVIGAIFRDSRSDLQPCRRFLDRIGLAPYLRRVCVDRVDVEHPRNALQRIAGSEPVQWTVGVEREGEGDDEREGEGDHDHFHGPPSHLDQNPYKYHCTVSVNDEPLACVAGCLTKEEAMATAAEWAKNRMVERRKEREGSGQGEPGQIVGGM